MLTNPLFLGLDFGSDSVRAVLVSGERGVEAASSVKNYPRWGNGEFSSAIEGRFRQHPLDYLEAMTDAVREVLQGADAGLVSGIGVDTTGSTPCAVDSQGTPLAMKPAFSNDPDAMFILWKDHTAIHEADEINGLAHSGKYEDYTRFSGRAYSCEWFWAKILHIMRKNERVRDAAASWIEHCDWICAELAGIHNAKLVPRGRCAAGHKALWNASWGGLPPLDFFAELDPVLCSIAKSYPAMTMTADKPVGKLSGEWAEKLGLPAGIPIAGGMVDCHCGAVGAGITKGVMVKVVGTSTCDVIAAPQFDHCISGVCGQVDGSVLPGMLGIEAGQSAFGDIFAWFKNILSWSGDVSLAELEKAAGALPWDPEAPVALDWFNGRRSPDADPLCKGAITGLTLGTSTPRLYRTLIEAACFGSRRIADRLAEEGVNVNSIVAVGGIANRSPLVMQTLADALERDLVVSKSTQACALGAAMFASVAAGYHANMEDAIKAMGQGAAAVYKPVPENVDICRSLYAKYCRLAALGD